MSPQEFGKRIGKTVTTLQRWDNSGKFPAHRTPTNRRFYTEDQYNQYMGISQSNNRINVIYSRVSTIKQKDDLKNQTEFLQTYCNSKGIIVSEVITDIGSGLNYNRKKWNVLIDRVINSEIDTIYIAYPDRFIRFGFDWFERLCLKFNTKIIVVNNQNLSPEQELTEDLINIINVFSCSSYRLRKYKKGLINNDKNTSNKNKT